MRRVATAAAGVLLLAGCSSEAGPSCPPCSADAACVQLACVCEPSHVGDGLTCTATGLQPGAPWPAEGGNAGHSGQSLNVASRTGTLRWRFATQAAGATAARVESPIVGADGTVYFACGERVYAVRPDGTAAWSYGEASYAWATPAIGADGRIYVHGSDGATGKLVAIDPAAAAPIVPAWSFLTDRNELQAPVIGANGTIYAGTDSGLVAVNPDGTLRWFKLLALGGMRSPAIGADGTLYVVDQSGVVHALRPDGSPAWSVAIGEQGAQPVVGADGMLYVLAGRAAGNALVALRPDGTTRWSWPGAATSLLAVGADGTPYVAVAVGFRHQLYALDPAVVASGGTAPRWTYDPPTGLLNSSPAVDASGTVYLTDSDGAVRAISAGALLWSRRLAIGTFPARSAPAIGGDGTVYAGDGDGYLNAFGP